MISGPPTFFSPSSPDFTPPPLPLLCASAHSPTLVANQQHHPFQYQALADKYAPCAPDVAETIAKLQIPPTPTSANFVPLPSRNQADSSQAQLAVFIREGRKVANQLSAFADANPTASGSSRETPSTRMTSDLSTVLEKDFTVPGKQGQLQCPFSAMKDVVIDEADEADPDPTPHHSKDPICAAMYEEATSAPAPNGSAANKCPIRFMDQHSPEEIARYVETHKHELPRSHEVCLRRNQKNEEQIRKLDAKYGNLVSMIQDLSHLHAPMLPEAELERQNEADGSSNRRVSDWAQNVSASAADGLVAAEDETEVDATDDDQDLDRTGHFDRPLKEVRVGESPSRPWGISVPIPPPYEHIERPVSPPAPVRMPSPTPAPAPVGPTIPSASRPSKCPFDHTKMRLNGPGLAEFPKMEEPRHSSPPPPPPPPHETGKQATTNQQQQPPFITTMNMRQQQQHLVPDSPPPSHQPAFLTLPGGGGAAAAQGKEGVAAIPMAFPQMVFNGPVFIGYPMEQAIQFMQHLQSQQPQPQQQPQ